MPTIPLGKPPLGPNHREVFSVLLDDMPHGANQCDRDEDGNEQLQIGTCSLPFDRATSQEKSVSSEEKSVHSNGRTDLHPSRQPGQVGDAKRH